MKDKEIALRELKIKEYNCRMEVAKNYTGYTKEIIELSAINALRNDNEQAIKIPMAVMITDDSSMKDMSMCEKNDYVQWVKDNRIITWKKEHEK